jgi:hypothetical protein
MPARIMYINGFKGLRQFLDLTVSLAFPHAYGPNGLQSKKLSRRCPPQAGEAGPQPRAGACWTDDGWAGWRRKRVGRLAGEALNLSLSLTGGACGR